MGEVTNDGDSPGTLKIGEPHPASYQAMAWLRMNWDPMWNESLASTAMSGNRLAEICLETLVRIEKGLPVSDRYLLGLAWTLRWMLESDEREISLPEGKGSGS